MNLRQFKDLKDLPFVRCRTCGIELTAISKDSPEEYHFCASHKPKSQHSTIHKENAEMATATTEKKAASKKYQPSTGKAERKMHKPANPPAQKVKRAKGTVEKPINWLYEEIPSEDGIAIEKLQAMFALKGYSEATKKAQLYRAEHCGDFMVVDNVIRLKKSVADARAKAAEKAKEEKIAKQMEKDAAKEKEKEAVAAAKAKEQKAIADAKAEEEKKKAAKEKPAAK